MDQKLNKHVFTLNTLLELGLEESFVKGVVEAGIWISLVNLSPNEMRMTFHSKSETLNHYDMSATCFSLVKSGEMGSTTKKFFLDKLRKALQHALAESFPTATEAEEYSSLWANLVASEVVKPDQVNFKKKPPKKSDAWAKKIITEDDVPETPPPTPEKVVALIAATDLYQPVKGTSPGSIYHVVAMAEDLKIAVRYKDSISIRAEGDISKYLEVLSSCGFSIKKKGGKPVYASQHFEYDNDLSVARRAVGAMIVGLGVEMSTPVPDLEKIREAGV